MKNEIIIRVCMGPGGIAAGGKAVLDSFQASLSHHKVSAVLKENCSAHKVGCLGLCARDVLVEIEKNGTKTVYQYVKPDMVERIVTEHLLGGVAIPEWLVDDAYKNFYGKQIKVVLEDCGRFDPEDIEAYKAAGGYTSAKKVLSSLTPEAVIEEIKKSGLRGRGGAGFPTGLKWEFGRKSPGDEKYIICNADEGDPGAFMDRAVIEGNPHTVIEGMTIGAYAIGASKGYVYIRAEYPLAVERLKLAIKQAREAGYLGKKIFGSEFSFDIIIKLGAGAFVCGEETALIASIEGLRGMPRAKPPFPAQKGLWNKPTIINNVETLANIAPIIKKGAAWFASYGTEKSKGTKVFALTGKVKNTGLIEVPMGITLREIIYEIGGGIVDDKELKAVQTGGPSGGCIPAEQLDIKVDYESLAKVGSIVGSGGMIVLDSENCMVNMAKYFLQFTQSESCGKCVPCRIGTKRLLEILIRVTEGKGRHGDIELLESLSNDIKTSSLCGLGQTAPNPILSTIRHYRDEFEAHINEKRCPAGVCKDLISFAILEEACKGCGACVRVCPTGAILGEKKKPHTIVQEKCIQCGTCYDTCKFKAIKKGSRQVAVKA
jgi:NADH-quinone oxidoreductase subunit F